MEDTIPQQYVTDQEKAVYIAGYLGFGVEYLVKCVQLDRKKILQQFFEEEGTEYNIWLHGNYVAQTELRKTIMESALNSSSPNIEKMLQYFAATDDEINNIEVGTNLRVCP